MAARKILSSDALFKESMNERTDARNRLDGFRGVMNNRQYLENLARADSDNAEYDSLRKVFDLKKKMAKQQFDLEKKYLRDLQKLEEKGDAKAIKRLKDKHEKEKAHYEEMQANAEKIAALGENFDKINKQWTGNIGSLIGSFKKAKLAGDALGSGAAASALINGIAKFAKQLDNKIEEVAGYNARINARLTGSGKRWNGSGGISDVIASATGASPFVKTQDVYKNVDALVASGVAYNVEQRAFLQTIKESIATTFDAANGTLLQLVRIQQADTTAARLGMEYALTQYLNNMYQTTEYLSDLASNVKSAMYEATALAGATGGVALEYQVQKWLGSMYSVGMSSNAVSSIASSLGYLGSGDISSLSGSAGQVLLAMAASRAGLSYGELLTQGLNDSNTNALLQSMVDYLASIASDNRVVQSAYARMYGLSSSDILAASNLASVTKNISKNTLGFGGAYDKLIEAMNKRMASNISVGGMISNVWDNIQYTLAQGIAANPALYGIWKAAGLLEETMGGIPIPMVDIEALAMGTGGGVAVDLETTMSNMLMAGALGGSLLGSIGKIGSSLISNILPSNMLATLGINSGLSTVRKGAENLFIPGSNGFGTSSSVYRGNQSADDAYEATMTQSDRDKLQAADRDRKVNPQDENEGEEDIKLKDLNETVVIVKDMLQSIITSRGMKVWFDQYGA